MDLLNVGFFFKIFFESFKYIFLNIHIFFKYFVVFYFCQAEPKPQPANPQLGAELALFSQLWGTYTIHPTPGIVGSRSFRASANLVSIVEHSRL